MTRQPEKAVGTELQVASARWLTYLTTAVAFLLIWLVEPQQISVSVFSPPVLALLAGALLYNLIVTLMALIGWMTAALPLFSLVGDVIVMAAAYYILIPTPTAASQLVDPLYFLVLLPLVVTSIRFHWAAGMIMAVLLGALRSFLLLWGVPDPFSPPVLLPALFGILFLAGFAFLSGFLPGTRAQSPGRLRSARSRRGDVDELRHALQREEALQHITSTLGDTLNFERVLESALDIAEQEMQRWGAKGQLAAIIFLYERSRLRVAAARKLPRYEQDERIAGSKGVVAECLSRAETVLGGAPHNDPELAVFTGLANCLTSVAVPLRAGFESYGAMVYATAAFAAFDTEQIEFLNAIADRATISLHNALLYQNLQQEKDRIVRIEEDARHKLARDLHDGPTQSVSAIAMRVNFVRKMMVHEPDQLEPELETIEQMARHTVKEIRHMLFTMRPLVLETQGLVSALQTLVEKIQEMSDLNIQIREVGDAASHLNAKQAGVIFYIVEEALGNARKYSQASLVQVSLWIESDLFVIQVSDDGVGFDTKEVLGDYDSRGSLGMINMRERAELINGSLDVKSAPGQGTAITVVVPLGRGAAA